MPYQNIPEGELKNKVAQDYFSEYDCTKADNCDIDFWVTDRKNPNKILLWVEVKRNIGNIENMLT